MTRPIDKNIICLTTYIRATPGTLSDMGDISAILNYIDVLAVITTGISSVTVSIL
jgi:hypothetical protein